MQLRDAQIGIMIAFVPSYLADAEPANRILAFFGGDNAEDYTGSKATG